MQENINQVLPDYIMGNIFKYLTVYERTQARFVCKKWCHTMRFSYFPDFCVVIHAGNMNYIKEYVQEQKIQTAERMRFFSIKLYRFSDSQELRELLEMIGAEVLDLHLSNLAEYNYVTGKIFPNVKTLQIVSQETSIGCIKSRKYIIELSGFPQLTQLDCLACMNICLYWSIFKQLISVDLKLKLRTIKFRCVLRKHDFFTMLTKHATGLRQLEIAFKTNGNEEDINALKQLCKKLCNLRVLIIYSLIKNTVLRAMLHNLPEDAPLREFGTAGDLQTYETLNELLQKWHGTLQVLRLRLPNTGSYGNNLIQLICRCKLREVDIFNGYKALRTPLLTALCANDEACAGLRVLKITEMQWIEDEIALIALLKRVKLHILDIRDSTITLELWHTILAYQKCLAEFRIRDICMPMEKHGVEQQLIELQSINILKELRMLNMGGATECILNYLNLPKLRILYLLRVDCRTVQWKNERQFERIEKIFVGDHYGGFNDAHLKTLIAVFKNLRSINIGECEVTESGALNALINCKHLQVCTFWKFPLLVSKHTKFPKFRFERCFGKSEFWDKREFNYDSDSDFEIHYV